MALRIVDDEASLRPLAGQEWPIELIPIFDELAECSAVYGTMARHPHLLLAWREFRNHIDHQNTLAPRMKGLVVLRTLARLGSEALWKHHVDEARGAGITEDEIAATKTDSNRLARSPLHQCVLRAIDECCSNRKISHDTFQRLAQNFNEQELLDLMFTVGMYLTLGIVANTVELSSGSDGPGSEAEATR